MQIQLYRGTTENLVASDVLTYPSEIIGENVGFYNLTALTDQSSGHSYTEEHTVTDVIPDVEACMLRRVHKIIEVLTICHQKGPQCQRIVGYPVVSEISSGSTHPRQ